MEPDDKASAKVPDIWGGKKFGFIQLLHYCASVAGMLFYLGHYLLSGPLLERVAIHSTLELILLLTRWANEVYFGKWGVGDVFHHLAMVFGYYLVFYVPSCSSFGWSLCQMQVLHVPMLLWYLGCRRGCYATSLSVTRTCVSLFPLVWILAVAHRASIITFVTFDAFQSDKLIAGCAGAVFAVVLGYLDVNWTTYFFTELDFASSQSNSKAADRTPRVGVSVISIAQAVYFAAMYSAILVVSFFNSAAVLPATGRAR